ncbi:SRPBCC family protein [Occallatibacter riparius]|uniref:ATPase n=1 Tax=Occallatibacter riparius TaxID=1002689 RepID=A0A9J7BHD0_9BACT|nr:SRPBCC family protein [Occallatibacter riparius]UWZ82200.1 ATPase [Occallatibacter riparius]
MADALRETPNREDLPRVGSAGVIENGRYMPPPADMDGKTWVRTTALVQASPLDCYELWRNYNAVPLWQEQIKEVRITGPKISHWVWDVDGKTTEWDEELMQDEPGKRIAWRTIQGDAYNAGEVIFDEAPGGRGTLITYLQEFGEGKAKTAIDTVRNRNPKQSVIENLRHFKAFMETGEIPRTQGQPHGPRGMSGNLKAELYGEHIKTPPGLKRAS